MTRTRHALALLAPLVLLLAACGDDDDDAAPDAVEEVTEDDGDTSTTAEDTTSSTAAEDDGGGEATAGAALVEVASSDLGEILLSQGMTLYVFLPDDGGASTCYGQCAQNWPPLVADGEVTVGEALDDAMFATAPRDDGGEQVTVNGWPLYFFANDSAPGDVNGQGVGDNWYVVGPDGEHIES